ERVVAGPERIGLVQRLARALRGLAIAEGTEERERAGVGVAEGQAGKALGGGGGQEDGRLQVSALRGRDVARHQPVRRERRLEGRRGRRPGQAESDGPEVRGRTLALRGRRAGAEVRRRPLPEVRGATDQQVPSLRAQELRDPGRGRNPGEPSGELALEADEG